MGMIKKAAKYGIPGATGGTLFSQAPQFLKQVQSRYDAIGEYLSGSHYSDVMNNAQEYGVENVEKYGEAILDKAGTYKDASEGMLESFQTIQPFDDIANFLEAGAETGWDQIGAALGQFQWGIPLSWGAAGWAAVGAVGAAGLTYLGSKAYHNWRSNNEESEEGEAEVVQEDVQY